jgi:hypothetical protein
MNGSDYFNFIVTNLTNRTTETLRYQPATIYNIGGLIVDNQYTIAVQAVIDGIPRGISVPTEPFAPGYGILQFTKRLQYQAQSIQNYHLMYLKEHSTHRQMCASVESTFSIYALPIYY